RARSGEGAVTSQAALVKSSAGVALGQLLPSLWHEWLLAYAPVSVLWPFAKRHWPLVAVPWLVYQTGSFVVLQRIDEHGTYMVPLVLPAAFVALQVLRGRTVWLPGPPAAGGAPPPDPPRGPAPPRPPAPAPVRPPSAA